MVPLVPLGDVPENVKTAGCGVWIAAENHFAAICVKKVSRQINRQLWRCKAMTEKRTPGDAHDRLAAARTKMEYIEFSLSFMDPQALMGDEQIAGLAYILRDIKDAIGGAVEFSFSERKPVGQ